MLINHEGLDKLKGPNENTQINYGSLDKLRIPRRKNNNLTAHKSINMRNVEPMRKDGAMR